MADYEPVIEDDIETESIYSFLGLICYSVYAVFLILACLINGSKTKNDLFSVNRSSVAHLTNPPKITGTYSFIILLTELSIFFFTICVVIMPFTYLGVSFTNSAMDCNLTESIAASNGEIAKIMMYIIYLARLYWLYSDSKVQKLLWYLKCSSQWILLVAFIIITYGIILILLVIIIWNSVPGQYIQYSDGAGFPDLCDSVMEPVTGSIAMIGDMIFSFGLLYLFWQALKKTLEINKKYPADELKIRYFGFKLLVLTGVASFSTVILITLTIILDLNFIVGFDSIIHTICILLMTPYYPDKIYYNKLCYCCIRLCGAPKGNDNDNNNNSNEEALLSVDTFDQLRVLGIEQNKNYNNNNDNNANIELQSDNVQDVQDAQDVQDVQDVQNANDTDVIDQLQASIALADQPVD